MEHSIPDILYTFVVLISNIALTLRDLITIIPRPINEVVLTINAIMRNIPKLPL